jgi:hypothetical protein
VRFQVLTVASTNMRAFWDLVLCSLVEVYTDMSGVLITSIIRIHHPDDESTVRNVNDDDNDVTAIQTKLE